MAAETVKIALNIAEGANEIKYCDAKCNFRIYINDTECIVSDASKAKCSWDSKE